MLARCVRYRSPPSSIANANQSPFLCRPQTSPPSFQIDHTSSASGNGDGSNADGSKGDGSKQSGNDENDRNENESIDGKKETTTIEVVAIHEIILRIATVTCVKMMQTRDGWQVRQLLLSRCNAKLK